MKTLNAFKYFSPIGFFILAYFSFKGTGWVTWMPIIYGFILIPFIELFIAPSEKNLEQAEEEIAKHDKLYDWMLYFFTLLMYPTIAFYLWEVKIDFAIHNDWLSIAGKTASMGMLCGTIGINIAHELGHRITTFERSLAKIGLLTSLYMHFYTEHNKGHHKNVATYNDPASARFNEPLYFFWPRTILYSYLSAWHIANSECKRRYNVICSFKNEMILFTVIQTLFIGIIWIAVGWKVCACFIVAAIIGMLLLETVNYIEHYGLVRKEISPGKYERTLPIHSWNSNHFIGRVMLFELSRHSDHHYIASRKYQTLRHHEDAPQMPTGYPGMMLLSTIPPLFFKVMNPKVRKIMGEVNEKA